MTPTLRTCITGLALLLASQVASAGPINWLGVANTSGPETVATFGTTVEAVNASTSNSGSVSVSLAK